MPPELPSIMKVMDTLETLQAIPEDPEALAHSVRSVYAAQGLPLREDLLQKAIAAHADFSLEKRDEDLLLPDPVTEGVGTAVSLTEMAGAFGFVLLLASLVWVGFVCFKGQVREAQDRAAALTLLDVATDLDQSQVLYPGHPVTDLEEDTDTRIAMQEDAQGRVHTTWSHVRKSGCQAMVNAVLDSQVAKTDPDLAVTVNGRLISNSDSLGRSLGVCQMEPEGTALIEMTRDLKPKTGVHTPG